MKGRCTLIRGKVVLNPWMEGPAAPSGKNNLRQLREFRNNFFHNHCFGNPRSSAHWRNLKLGPSPKEDPCHMLIFIYSHRIPWSLFFLMKDDNGSATRFVPCIPCCVSASLSSPFCCYFEVVSEKQILPKKQTIHTVPWVVFLPSNSGKLKL